MIYVTTKKHRYFIDRRTVHGIRKTFETFKCLLLVIYEVQMLVSNGLLLVFQGS